MLNGKILVACTGMIAGLLQTPFAAGYRYMFTSAGESQSSEYVDFATSTTSGHEAWSLWDKNSGGTANIKYMWVQLQGAGGGQGTCYNFETQVGTGSAGTTDIVAYMDGTMIDDDGPSGLLPYFKVWAQSGTNLKLSAYSTSYNSVDWNLVVNSSVLANQTACLNAYGGSSVPLITSTGTVVVGPTNSN